MPAVIIVLSSLIVLFFALIFYIYYTAFYNSPKRRKVALPSLKNEQHNDADIDLMKQLRQNIISTPFEAVEITAADGTVLKGKYYHFSDNAPVEIIFHGYRSCSANDCGGGFKLAREAGYNVLLPDHRGHGESGGNTVTFGIMDRLDCLEWAKYIAQRFENSKIFLTGVSMGGATVLMASDLPLPQNVVGIIADCPYSSPEEIILRECKKMGFPPRLSWPFIKISARIFGGFDLKKTDAVTAVKNAKVPILIIHGKADQFVPCEMGVRIFNACTAPKKLFTVEGAGHGLSFLVDEAGYRKTVFEFCDAVLCNKTEYFE